MLNHSATAMRSVFISLLLLLLSSCLSNKKITYFQNVKEGLDISNGEFIPFASDQPLYFLQPFDIVDIDFSAYQEDLTKVFEFQGGRNIRSRQGGAGSSGDILFFSGYTIDVNGEIELPKIGKIKIAGLTEEEAKNVVQESINLFFKEEVYVRLKLGGIRFTALGEFNEPGAKLILKNRATILEALAVSGDASLIADRSKLLIIRQYPGGAKIHDVNLNDRSLISSPFYFIQPNDVLYLEPLKIRQIGRTESLSSSLSTVISITSSFIFLGFLIFNNAK